MCVKVKRDEWLALPAAHTSDEDRSNRQLGGPIRYPDPLSALRYESLPKAIPVFLFQPKNLRNM